MGKSILKKSKIFIELLQNGEFLAEWSQPVKKRGTINITAKMNGKLSVPFYPLAHDIDILHIDRNGIHLLLEPGWEGFITSEGQVFKIAAVGRNKRNYTMQNGDYGSIHLGDLRVLIRIGPEREKRLIEYKKNPIYRRGKTFPLWVGDRDDVLGLSAGFAAAALVIGGFSSYLWMAPDDRPRVKTELADDYVIPFIHHNHLEHAPEALQQSLDRSKFIDSTTDYYQNITDLILGYSFDPKANIYKSTVELYQKYYDNQRTTITAKIDEQKKTDKYALQKPGTALISIPSAVGESFAGSLIRLRDKIEIQHKGFDLLLKSRRAATAAWEKHEKYDYTQYKQVSKMTEIEEAMSKIKVWDVPTDEEAMYTQAMQTGKLAYIAQRKIAENRKPVPILDKENASPIGIPSGVKFASFLGLSSLAGLNEKIPYIRASEYGAPEKVKVREPLVGELNPDLIEKAISRNKFQLQLCFELALRRNRSLEGHMEWKWRLDSRGKISELSLVDSTIKDRRMVRCVRRKIVSWRFPRPKRGSVEVTYPFHFTPRRG